MYEIIRLTELWQVLTMVLNDLLKEKNMSMYRLHIEASIPQATLSDLCSGKTSIVKCNAETLYKLAKALKVSMEYLIEAALSDKSDIRPAFETFKSNTCHYVKDKGDIGFIIDTLESDQIRKLYNRKWYAECFYLLAMVDYLSRENNVPLCGNYNDIRSQKLQSEIFPTSLLISCAALKDESAKDECRKNAIPEFKKFNIMERDIRDVY